MRIERVETIALSDMEFEETGWVEDIGDDYRKLLFVRLHTDGGVVGLGETYPRPHVDSALIHEHIAPRLLEAESVSIEGIWEDVFRHANYFGGYGGGEMRALSAIDIALWDLKGKSLGVPIHDLFGGARRTDVRTYNTCYESEYDFVDSPVALAEDLLAEGIEAMKIWPFDDVAYENEGSYISRQDLRRCTGPLRRIREEIGDKMEVALEFHGLWNAQCAKRIANYVEAHDPLWLEELLEVGNLSAYADVAGSTSVPVTVSERLMTSYRFAELISTVDVDVVMFDLEWVGGFTAARRVAALAGAHHLPVAPHNCGGPVLHFATLQLASVLPNTLIVESVRGRYDGWHQPLVTEPATAADGRLQLPDGPGLGTALDPDVLDAPGVTRRVTER